mmetsp:Transcript_36528/g.78889  ORF Transcript_36528/g.78889 Transcript_36528/m.78889 type:complete len:250 (-) Transcript_36528:471-1220(-)
MKENELQQFFHAQRLQRSREGVGPLLEQLDGIHAEFGKHVQRRGDGRFRRGLDAAHLGPVRGVGVLHGRDSIDVVVDGSGGNAALDGGLGEGAQGEVGHHFVDPGFGEVGDDLVVVGDLRRDADVTISVDAVAVLLLVDAAEVPFLLVVPKWIRCEFHLGRVRGVGSRDVVGIAVGLDGEALDDVLLGERDEDGVDAKVVADVLARVEVSHEFWEDGTVGELVCHFGEYDGCRIPLLHVLGSMRNQFPQ